MKSTRVVLAIMVLCGLAMVANAQMFGGRPPSMRGVWKPVVGSGGAYEMQTRREGTQNIEMAVVGSETVNGATGYWLEMLVHSREGETIVKQLYVMDGKNVGIKRMIMQPPQMDPMEMPMNNPMMNRQQDSKPQSTDAREGAEKVGTESITTPAGTFECDHYRTADKSTDMWISEKVSPWGLVKMVGKDESMVLTKVVSNAKTRITKTPTMFDPAAMMRGRNPN
ncbi:MAG: hypothetical protein HY046_11440 [Acidobacteria bacterium]|nr:hypothetical protein [Acidobacteriota bacterium]